MLLLPPGVAPSTLTRLSLEVADSPGILLRVLGICQRRGASVVAMTYVQPRIELAVRVDPERLPLLRARLEALVDVLAVETSPRFRAWRDAA
jgi:acetolactate synthase regulatory subunit